MDLLASNTTEEARRVFCIYPISGAYTSFQRDLFYLTTTIDLLGHAHEWLTAGCLAFAVSYSSTAATHGLALAFQGDCHRDGDALAVDIIVWWAIWASFLCSLFYPWLLYRKLALLARTWNCLLVTTHLALLFNSPRLLNKMASSLVLSRLDKNGQWSDPCAGMEARTLFRSSQDTMSSVVWDRINITATSAPRLSDTDGEVIPKPINISVAEVFAILMAIWLRNSLFITPSILAVFLDRRVARSRVFVRLLAKRVLHTPSKRNRFKLSFEITIVRVLQLSWLLVQCFPILVLFEIAVTIILHCLQKQKLRLQDISQLEPQLSKMRFLAAKHAAATTARLLGGDEMPTIGSWVRQHRLVIFYIQARDWFTKEWDETKKWWRFPEKQAIDSLSAEKKNDDADKKFAASMIQALGDFTDRTGFILPLPVPMQLFGQNRGQGDLPKYLVDGSKSSMLSKTTTEGKDKENKV